VVADSVRRNVTRARKLARILVVPGYRTALRTGVAAAVEHERVDLPSDIRTVIDVGANRGQFALVAAHRWPAARIVCFEPLPAAGRRLAGVLAGLPGAELRHLALSDNPGEAHLHVARADDSSSLLPIGPRQVATFPGTDEVGVLPVQVSRLDHELAAADIVRPSLLKIDVQGGELQVLRGASGLLPLIDVVLVEGSFVELYSGQPLVHELVEFLGGQGFLLGGAGAPTTDAGGRVVQLDLVFTRRD
jgi:FkbM family methyltransferase